MTSVEFGVRAQNIGESPTLSPVLSYSTTIAQPPLSNAPMCEGSGDEGLLMCECDSAPFLPQAPDRPRDVALESTHGLAFGLSLGGPAIKIGACLLGVVSLG